MGAVLGRGLRSGTGAVHRHMNRLDHIVFAAQDLDAAVESLHGRLGVRAGAGGRHVGFGTHNALLSLGEDAYLEVIAPDPTQPPPARRPFGLDSLAAPGLAAWAVACTDIDATVARARELGGGPVPFLIGWGVTVHPARSAPSGLHLLEFRIDHPDPASIAGTRAALDVDVPVAEATRIGLVAIVAGPAETVELR